MDGNTAAEMKWFKGRIPALAGPHQERTARHLGYLALALAVFSLIGLVSATYSSVGRVTSPGHYQMVLWTTVALVLLSCAIFVLSRSGIDAQRKLDLGLVYQVLGSFTWAVHSVYSMPPHTLSHTKSVSFIILWVTVFPIVAPSKFGRSFVANVLAGSTLYLAYGSLSLFDGVATNLDQVRLATGPVLTVALLTMIPVYFQNKMRKDLEAAERLGSYELVAKLGEGGMGEVWRARHNLLAHETAVKLFRPGVLARKTDSNVELAARRFEREARATAALKSLNTIDLYDFGVTEGGTFYYVMDLLDGMDLRTLVERFGPVHPARAIHLLRQVCYSLIEAHENGLVHRDIKPANIFVCRMKPHYDVIKVLDFGLVKPTTYDSEQTDLTIDGHVAGTPACLAPEQARGDKQIDGRADLYSLGCVAYWLVTGCEVFDLNTAIKMILAHVGEKPVLPSARTELEIPATLEDAIMRCLEKDPAHRPQSAAELEEILAAVEPQSSWSLSKAERWWRAHLP